MSDWSDLDLPLPQRGGYSITAEQGLLRTPFQTAQPRQLHRWKLGRHVFSLTFLLTQAELQVAEAFLDASGYDWFTMGLTSRLGDCVQHKIRLIEDYSTKGVGEDSYQLTCTAEGFLSCADWLFLDIAVSIDESVYGTWLVDIGYKDPDSDIFVWLQDGTFHTDGAGTITDIYFAVDLGTLPAGVNPSLYIRSRGLDFADDGLAWSVTGTLYDEGELIEADPDGCSDACMALSISGGRELATFEDSGTVDYSSVATILFGVDLPAYTECFSAVDSTTEETDFPLIACASTTSVQVLIAGYTGSFWDITDSDGFYLLQSQDSPDRQYRRMTYDNTGSLTATGAWCATGVTTELGWYWNWRFPGGRYWFFWHRLTTSKHFVFDAETETIYKVGFGTLTYDLDADNVLVNAYTTGFRDIGGGVFATSFAYSDGTKVIRKISFTVDTGIMHINIVEDVPFTNLPPVLQSPANLFLTIAPSGKAYIWDNYYYSEDDYTKNLIEIDLDTGEMGQVWQLEWHGVTYANRPYVPKFITECCMVAYGTAPSGFYGHMLYVLDYDEAILWPVAITGYQQSYYRSTNKPGHYLVVSAPTYDSVTEYKLNAV